MTEPWEQAWNNIQTAHHPVWLGKLLPDTWTPIGELGLEYMVSGLQVNTDVPDWEGLLLWRHNERYTSRFVCYLPLREQFVRDLVYRTAYKTEKDIREGIWGRP